MIASIGSSLFFLALAFVGGVATTVLVYRNNQKKADKLFDKIEKN